MTVLDADLVQARRVLARLEAELAAMTSRAIAAEAQLETIGGHIAAANADLELTDGAEGLTVSERTVFALLIRNGGKVVPKAAIWHALYPRGEGADPKIVDVFVCKLRKKIKGARFAVESVWGEGYRAVAKKAAA